MGVLCRKQIVLSVLAGMAWLGAAQAQQPGTQQQSANIQQAENKAQNGATPRASGGQQAANAQQTAESQQSVKSKAGSGQKSVTTNFVDAQGKQIGKAMLMDTPAGLLIQMEAAGLPPGEHGFHIHERGVCEPKEGFKTAGGHFSPRKEPHGFFDKKGRHAGDMPNQIVSQDGKLQADVLNREVVLNSASLLDKDGSALIVHAKPDDYVTQPSGAAGDRIACAVIHPASGQKTAQSESAGKAGSLSGTEAVVVPGKTAQQTGSTQAGGTQSSAR